MRPLCSARLSYAALIGASARGRRHLRSVEIIREPWLQFVQHVVAGGRVDTLVAEHLLRLANVARGELGADKATEVVRLDAHESSQLGIATDHPPHRTRIHRSIGW